VFIYPHSVRTATAHVYHGLLEFVIAWKSNIELCLQPVTSGGKTASFESHEYSLPKHDFSEQAGQMYRLLLVT